MKKDWDNCGAARREFLKNSYGVVFRSQNGRQRALPSNPNRHRQSSHDFWVAIEPMSSWCLISHSQYKLGGEALSIPSEKEAPKESGRVTRLSNDPQCYWQPLRRPLPSRAVLVCPRHFRLFRQVADTSPPRAEGNHPTPCLPLCGTSPDGPGRQGRVRP